MAAEKIRYYYNGPLYRFNDVYSRNWEAWTEAVSERQAINNLNVKAKKQFGFSVDARLNIDPKYLKISEKHYEDDSEEIHDEEKPTCDKCGALLDDSGSCPYCDQGEEERINEDFERITAKDEEWLDSKLDEAGFNVVSKKDWGHYGDKYDQYLDVHYQIISKEGDKKPEDLDEAWDKVNEILDEFEDMTGSPCTINMGLQSDGFISAGFDCRAIFYKPGEDMVVHKPDKLIFKNGKPVGDETKAQLKDIANRLGVDEEDVIDFIPLDKNTNEDLELDESTYNRIRKYISSNVVNTRGESIMNELSELTGYKFAGWRNRYRDDGLLYVLFLNDPRYVGPEDLKPVKEYCKEKGYRLFNWTYSIGIKVPYNDLISDEPLDESLEEDIIIKPGSTTIKQVYKEFDSRKEAVDYIIAENGFGEMNIRYIPKTKKYRVVWEEAENLEEDNKERSNYDSKVIDLAKRVNNACNLSEDDYQLLIHDLNNLRGDEWLSIVESSKDEDLISDFKAFISTDLEEDIEKHDELKENLEDKIKDIINKYGAEETSKITMFEVDPDKMWIEHFDDGDIDFSRFTEHEQKDGFNNSNGNKYYSFMISGGLNGSGEWDDYLEDIKKIFTELQDKLHLEPVLYKLDTDIADDVWTGKVFLYEKPTAEQLDECLLRALEEDIEKHDTLNPKLFDEGKKLKTEVREKILQIVKEFTSGLEEDKIKFDISDIVLVGSNCSYNYNKDSDLDVHIRMKTDTLDCPYNLYPLLYSAYRALWNNRYDIDFYDIPVELYVETEANDVKSNGIYSVLKDEWIKEPEQKAIPELDKEAFEKLFKEWEDKYFDFIEQIDEKEDIKEALNTDNWSISDEDKEILADCLSDLAINTSFIDYVEYQNVKGFDGGYKITFNDGSFKIFGWKDEDSIKGDFKLYLIAEDDNLSYKKITIEDIQHLIEMCSVVSLWKYLQSVERSIIEGGHVNASVEDAKVTMTERFLKAVKDIDNISIWEYYPTIYRPDHKRDILFVWDDDDPNDIANFINDYWSDPHFEATYRDLKKLDKASICSQLAEKLFI